MTFGPPAKMAYVSCSMSRISLRDGFPENLPDSARMLVGRTSLVITSLLPYW